MTDHGAPPFTAHSGPGVGRPRAESPRQNRTSRGTLRLVQVDEDGPCRVRAGHVSASERAPRTARCRARIGPSMAEVAEQVVDGARRLDVGTEHRERVVQLLAVIGNSGFSPGHER